MSEITIEELKDMLSDPFYAITVDPTYTFEHEPMVTKDVWVKNQVLSLIKDEEGNPVEGEALEFRLYEYFENLLNILEGNGKNRR